MTVPPHDIPAEQAVLSACLLDAGAIDACVTTLTSGHFYTPAHQFMWEGIVALVTAGQQVDTVSLAGWLRDQGKMDRVNVSYLGEIVDATPAIDHLETHRDRVIDRWQLRRAIELCHRSAAKGYSADSAADMLDSLEAGVFQLTAGRRPEQEPEHIRDVLLGEFESMAAGEDVDGVRPFLRSWRSKIHCMQAGELHLLAARPGMGKTALAMGQAAVTGKDGLVAIMSLEMPKKQLAGRILCDKALVDVSKYRRRDLSPDDWRNLQAAAQELSQRHIHIDDQPGLNLLQVRSKLRRISSQRKMPIALCVVDYIQLMSPLGRVESREEGVSSISQGLKRLSKEFSCPVLALSQLNRGVEHRSDKRPLLSDLRESGSLEQDADSVTFIYRDDYYNDSSQDKGVAELIVAKQRNGPTGMVRVSFVPEYTRFTDLREDQ